MIKNCAVCGESIHIPPTRGWHMRFPICSSRCLKPYLDQTYPERVVITETDRSRLYLNKDIDMSFRSEYERRTAEVFDACGIKYDYEKYIISVFTRKTFRVIYLPDFYLPDYGVFVEVKGIWSHGAYKKLKVCSEVYPIYLVTKEDIQMFGRKHGQRVAGSKPN